jgi:hypothetical protein
MVYVYLLFMRRWVVLNLETPMDAGELNMPLKPNESVWFVPGTMQDD